MDPAWPTAAPAGGEPSQFTQLSTLAIELKAGGPTPDAGVADAWNRRLKDESLPDTALIHFLHSADVLLERRESVDECPLCQQPIESARLQELVRRALVGFQAAAHEFETVQNQLRGLSDELTRAEDRETTASRRR